MKQCSQCVRAQNKSNNTCSYVNHFYCTSQSFSLNNSTDRLSSDNTTLVLTLDASNSTTNCFSKLDNISLGAVLNFFFRIVKLASWSSPQWNRLFFKHSVIRVAMVLKFLINPNGIALSSNTE